MTRNFNADFGTIDRQIFVRGKPMSKLAAFLCGVFVGLIAFILLLAFTYMTLLAMVTEAEMRAARNAVIGISQADRNCVEWRMDSDSAWRCIRR